MISPCLYIRGAAIVLPAAAEWPWSPRDHIPLVAEEWAPEPPKHVAIQLRLRQRGGQSTVALTMMSACTSISHIP